MTHELVISTPDNATVTPVEGTPGRYAVTKTVTTTVTTQTWIDVEVVEHPGQGRTVTFGFNSAYGTVAELKKLIEHYGQPDVCRIFTEAGDGIISWSNPRLALLKSDCVLVYSFKDWPLSTGAFASWMSSKPTNKFPEVWVCIDHEPEQGPEKGDPNPDTYERQWTEFLAIYNVHPRREEFYPLAIFTEYYARKYWTNTDPKTGKRWYDAFGHVVEMHGMRGVGFDIYDSSWPNYRTPQHRNEIPLLVATRARLPLLICELNIANKEDIDPDDSLAAAAYRANTNYLRTEVTHPVPYVMQYHLGGGVLYDRPRVKEAFLEAIAGNPS